MFHRAHEEYTAAMKLDGIRILDLSLFLPGPTVTQMMADHGADVIKIESVGQGEPTRSIGQRREGRSVYFDCTQRGKRSVTLNLERRTWARCVSTARANS